MIYLFLGNAALEVSNNIGDLDYLVQVCLFGLGAKICRKLALLKQDLVPLPCRIVAYCLCA